MKPRRAIGTSSSTYCWRLFQYIVAHCMRTWVVIPPGADTIMLQYMTLQLAELHFIARVYCSQNTCKGGNGQRTFSVANRFLRPSVLLYPHSSLDSERRMFIMGFFVMSSIS